MTERKWTPGPWEVDRNFEIGPRSDHDDQSFGMVLGCADAFGENKEANARLIAAAPDLYEALKASLDSLLFAQAELKAQAFIPMEDEGMLEDRIIKARAALAKARGET